MNSWPAVSRLRLVLTNAASTAFRWQGQLAVSGDSSQALDLALLQSAAAAEASSRIGDASPQNR